MKYIALLAASLLIPIATAQQKSYTLRGTVEKVDAAAKRLSVANEPIPGGMGAMTMTYGADNVDNDDLFGRIKPGDRITATMFEGDSTLHNVQIASPPAATDSARPATGGMRLEELERMALANNPTVAQAEANLRIAEGLARQAGFYPNPTVGYYGDEIRGGYFGGGKQGGFISQTIVTGGKLGAARRVSGLLASQSKLAGESQRFRILNNVRMLFYSVLAAQRLVEVRQNLAQLSADATQTAHQLANIGQADRPDVLQAEVEQQQAHVGLRLAQQNLRSSWRMLAAVAGKPDLPMTPLSGDLDDIPDLNYEPSLALMLRESPEIKLAEQNIQRAEASLSQARKAPIPDLQLYANLSQNNEPLETTHRPVGLNGGVQIGVQLPIFNRNQGNIAAGRGEIQSATQELARLKLQLARELAGMFRDYDSARETARQYKTEMLPRAQQAYDLYRANYQRMSAAYPQALISQRTLFQLEVDYVHALESAWQSSLAIRGFGLIDGLSTPMPAARGSMSGSASTTGSAP